MIRLWVISALAWASTVGFVCAQEPAKPAKQGPFVVMVGVAETADKTIQPRPTADADATALFDLLADPQYLGVPAERRILLTTKADAKRGGKISTRENILTALKEAVAKTGKDDPIYFGLFGRGASSGDATCFFAADSTFADRGKNGLLGSDLSVEFKKAKDQTLCLMMDVHFKGFDAGKETIVEPNLSDILKGVYGNEDREEAPLPHDKLVMLATIPGYDPVTMGDHGAFFTILREALTGKADTEGYEPDGLITADELVKYVETRGAEVARTLGKTVKEKEAIPYIIGEETSHFIITKNPAVTAAVTARLAAFDALAATLPKDVAAEGRPLLARMPKLKQQQELRKVYQSLVDKKLTMEEFATARTNLRNTLNLAVADAQLFARRVLRAKDSLLEDYVKKLNSGELIAASIRGLYRRLELEVPEEIEKDLKLGKALTDSQQRSLLEAARIKLGKREDLDGTKDADMAILMMVASLNDPYTTYYDKDTIKKMESQLRGEFRGVGIQIRRDLVRDGLLVVSPIKGSPAYKAGIKAGDLITEIRREVNAKGEPLSAEDPRVISTKGMKTEQALDIILGKPGVPVTLVVDRENADGKTESLTFDLKRGVIAVETVHGVKREEDDSWNFYLDEKQKIAYIQLSQFAPSTHQELERILRRLDKDGVKGVVLDLRHNPGGLLISAVLISDLFIEDGLVLEVRPRVGEVEKYYDRGFGKFTSFPMAVLINGQSASASEIVSACLQDYGRATIIGERTYGKGSVQQVKNFSPTGGEIKMTTARYFPPLGRNIDRLSTTGKPEEEWGVQPDKGFEIKLSREERQEIVEKFRDHEIIPRRDAQAPKAAKKDVKDRQLDAALDYLKKQIALNAGK